MTAPSIDGDFAPARRTAPWAAGAAAIAALAAYLALVAAGWWAVLNVAPDTLSVEVAGRTLTVDNVHNKIFGNAGLLFLMLPLALFIEAAVVGWQGSSTRQMLRDRTPSVKT